MYRSQKPAVVCETVGELKKAIAEIDDSMELCCSMESAVEVVVMYNEDGYEVHCSIEPSMEVE